MSQKETKLNRKAIQKISKTLEVNERLISVTVGYLPKYKSNAVVSIFDNAPFNLNTVLYVGLSNKNLIIIQENIFQKTKDILKTPINQRTWAQLTPDKTLDKLSLVWNGNQRVDILAFSQFRSESKAIVGVFCANQIQPASYKATEFQSPGYSPLYVQNVFKSNKSSANLANLAAVIGFVVLIVGSQMLEWLYAGKSPSTATGILTALVFGIFGFMGVIMIKTQEISVFLFTIRGKIAILQGIFLVVVSWGVALWSLYLVLASK